MKRVLLSVMILLCAISFVFAGGQSDGNGKVQYPTKNISVIIPYAPGGGSDILTRTIMKYVQMDRSFVAINVEGAGGYIGCMQAYNTKADGYTILAHNAMDVVSYTLSGQTDTPVWNDLETICMVVSDFNVIATNKQSGWKTLEQMVAYAKANPGKIRWGVTGAQTVNMVDTLRIVEALGLKGLVTLVPYDGGAASKTALLGNHIQVETNSSADIRSSLLSGDEIPLMVVAKDRIKALPNVPTTVEKGINITTAKPRGYYAPKGTPQYALDYLADAIKKVTEMPEFAETVEKLGWQVEYVDGDSSKAQVKKWVEELTPFFSQFN
ncbi:tripartite tricarboxylate transporter substrate binding protein [Treponema sp. OMZ 840]|uniref:Bug family tripartite tricarboxylate transporter substrate binding protein n=1 Tax=Treponema sp. OMZ 840 TaxID=244313 RepID=UPI003D91F51C